MNTPYKQPVANMPVTEQSINIKPTKQKWSLKKKIVVFAGVALAFIATVLVIALVATDAPLKISDQFISDIKDNNPSAAYDLMSSEAQSATNSQEFATIVDQLGPILTGSPKNISRDASTETGSNPSAKLTYEIEGSDSYTHILTINLVQVNGNWKILNFQSIKK